MAPPKKNNKRAANVKLHYIINHEDWLKLQKLKESERLQEADEEEETTEIKIEILAEEEATTYDDEEVEIVNMDYSDEETQLEEPKLLNIKKETGSQFVCNECGRNCSTKYGLSVHILTHTPAHRPYQCKYCKKYMIRKKRALEHVAKCKKRGGTEVLE